MVKGNISAKFTLFPVELIENNGLKPAELKLVESVIEVIAADQMYHSYHFEMYRL